VFQKRKHRHNRNPSAHQTQMRFFTVMFYVILLLLFGGLLWLLNKPNW